MRGRALPTGRHIGGRAGLQIGQCRIPEAGPELLLPTPVERLDRGLEAGFAWRREDGDNACSEAVPDDRPDRVRVVRPADEPRIVVELRIARTADLAPVLIKRADRQSSTHAGRRPDRDEPTVEADPGQDVEGGPALQAKAVDDVEAVELGRMLADVRQIPARGGCRPPDPPPRVQGAAPLQDPGDGADRRERTGPIKTGLQLAPDRDRAVVAQDALLAEHPPDVEDEIFKLDGRSLDPSRTRRPVTPLDLFEHPVTGAFQPELDGGE